MWSDSARSGESGLEGVTGEVGRPGEHGAGPARQARTVPRGDGWTGRVLTVHPEYQCVEPLLRPGGGKLFGGEGGAVSPGIDQLEYVSCTTCTFDVGLRVTFLQER